MKIIGQDLILKKLFIELTGYEFSRAFKVRSLHYHNISQLISKSMSLKQFEKMLSLLSGMSHAAIVVNILYWSPPETMMAAVYIGLSETV